MPLPPLPREQTLSRKEPELQDIKLIQADIHALFIYLQRNKDQLSDAVQTEIITDTYSDEKAQDAIGHIITGLLGIDVSYDDITPVITVALKNNIGINRTVPLPFSLLDTQCLIISKYLSISSSFELQGDSVLEVL